MRPIYLFQSANGAHLYLIRLPQRCPDLFRLISVLYGSVTDPDGFFAQ
jgi:hypothetical protein